MNDNTKFMWYVIGQIVLYTSLLIGVVSFAAYFAGKQDGKLPYDVRTYEYDGIPHQYIILENGYRGGIAHYPECKFCKNKEKQK